MIDPQVKARVETNTQEMSGECEWSSENLLAVSVPSEKAELFERDLSAEINSGLVF